MLADSITVNYKTNRYSFPSLEENQLHQQQPTVIVCLCVISFCAENRRHLGFCSRVLFYRTKISYKFGAKWIFPIPISGNQK